MYFTSPSGTYSSTCEERNIEQIPLGLISSTMTPTFIAKFEFKCLAPRVKERAVCTRIYYSARPGAGLCTTMLPKEAVHTPGSVHVLKCSCTPKVVKRRGGREKTGEGGSSRPCFACTHTKRNARAHGQSPTVHANYSRQGKT